MVSERHVSVIVQAGLALAPTRLPSWPADLNNGDTGTERNRWGVRRRLTRESASTVGQILLSACARSVDQKYGEDDNETPYLYRAPGGRWQPIEVLKAIDCYRYQACEADDWEESEAATICDCIYRALVTMLPGYEEAAWGIEEDTETLDESKRRTLRDGRS